MKKIIFKTPPWISAVLSGILVGLAYHQLHLGFLAYIGFIPILHAWIHHNVRNNFVSGYLFGVIYNSISNYWIGANSGAEFIVVIFSLISAVLYLSIYWGLVGAIIGLIKKKPNIYYSLPFLIVSIEWIRSFGPLGFAWGNLALTQMEYLPILQFIDYVGNYLITIYIVSVNVIIYYHIFEKKINKKYIFYICSIFLIVIVCGSLRIFLYNSKGFTNEIKVAVIQPNLDPNNKWDSGRRETILHFMDSLHVDAINLSPDIILFPETALPVYLRLNKKTRDKFQVRVNNSNIPILIGTVDRRIDSLGRKLYFNSAIYLQPNKEFDMYDKIHLVPFAEYDLLPNLFHPLGKLNVNLHRGVFVGGEEYKIFNINNANFSDLICYESTLPRYARRFVKKGAEFLMIQANDGWLGKTLGPYQHFEHARLRAIENRVPIVRSGNTGISGVIYPTGEVKKKVQLGKKLVFLEKIPIRKSDSFYSEYGEFFPVICLILFLFIGPILSCIEL